MKKNIYYIVSACAFVIVMFLRLVMNYDSVLVSLALFPTMVLFIQMHYGLQKKMIFSLIYAFIILTIWGDFSAYQNLIAMGGAALAVISGTLIDSFCEGKEVKN